MPAQTVGVRLFALEGQSTAADPDEATRDSDPANGSELQTGQFRFVVHRGDTAIDHGHLSQLRGVHARQVAEEAAKYGLPQGSVPHTLERTAIDDDRFELRV